jgi:hypothetical protein
LANTNEGYKSQPQVISIPTIRKSSDKQTVRLFSRPLQFKQRKIPEKYQRLQEMSFASLFVSPVEVAVTPTKPMTTTKKKLTEARKPSPMVRLRLSPQTVPTIQDASQQQTSYFKG